MNENTMNTNTYVWRVWTAHYEFGIYSTLESAKAVAQREIRRIADSDPMYGQPQDLGPLGFRVNSLSTYGADRMVTITQYKLDKSIRECT